MYRTIIKRKIDFILSLMGLIILGPVFIILCIWIKLDSKGPILFKQKRVGINKSYFNILKFRTMYIDTPKDMPTHMLKDPEQFITKSGKFLRKTSLDELPQIINILKGEMSIIGPRPALWNQDDLIAERDKYHANDVKPGLTGWAQINGRDELEIPVKAKLDGEYVNQESLLMDIKCFLGTIGSVLVGDGVVEGGTGEMEKASQSKSLEKLNKEIMVGAGVAAGVGIVGLGILGTIVHKMKKKNKPKKESKGIFKRLFFITLIIETVATVVINIKRKKKLTDNYTNEGNHAEDIIEDISDRKILITGANSYIGVSVENWLKDKSDKYHIDTLDMIDDSWRNHDFSKYDVVYHVAGIAHADVGNVSDEIKNKYYAVNTDLAIEVCKKAKEAGVKQFIFMSSMIVYSGCKETFITKETKPKPENFYGDSKLQADLAIQKLGDDDFKVCVIRPPMIYGKGSKGNYPMLAKMATKLPVFPIVKNRRSMLHIDNLCEFIRLMIDNEENGVFFPQNDDYTNTSDMVEMIAKVKGHRIVMIPGFNIIIKCISKIPGKIGTLTNKAFGDSAYDMKMSKYKEEYRKNNLWKSIEKTEKYKEYKVSKKKHILVISQYFYPEEFRINDLCREWVKKGFKVTVITGIPNYPQGKYYRGYGLSKKRKEVWQGVQILRLPLIPRGNSSIGMISNYLSFVVSGFVWKELTKIEADIVFNYEVSPMTQSLLGVWYSKRFNVPCYTYITDLWPDNVEIVTGLKSPLVIKPINKMVNYIYDNSTKIFTSSNSFVSKLIERGVNSNKVIYWPQYAEDFYKPFESEIDYIDEVNSITKDKFNITFAGNIGYAQGLDILPMVALKLKDINAKVRFNIIGDGRFKEKLMEEVIKSDVEDYFNFIDRQSPECIPMFLSASDMALISLSKSDVFAMTIPAKTQSCLACGIPILVSADGEIGNIINEAKCGFASNSQDISGLVENIIYALQLSENELKQLGINGLEYYEKNFKKEMLIEKMNNYIKGDLENESI